MLLLLIVDKSQLPGQMGDSILREYITGGEHASEYVSMI